MNLIPFRILLLCLAISVGALACQRAASSASTSPAKEAPKYGYSIVNAYYHDPGAFTQGLEFHDGKLIESTGGAGRSSLRRVNLETGDIVQKVDVPSPYFGEGLTVLNGRVYQLTWQHHLGFVYDYNTFQKVGEFNYSGEGWGLTNDGESLILTDGSNRIRFLDPDNFRVKKTIAVVDGNRAVNDLNEVEYIDGEIYSNVWHMNMIATIDAQSGRVKSWIDLKGLLQPGDVSDEESVLNGIAYDRTSDRLFVTGKRWPRVFEIRIKK